MVSIYWLRGECIICERKVTSALLHETILVRCSHVHICYQAKGITSDLFTRYITGTLQLLLAGYSDIPTNNTALIAIPDIGTHEEGKALICRHGISGIPPSNPIDHWNFVNDDDSEIRADTTGFSVSRGQNYGEVRLERRAGTYPLEGTYKCSVSVNSINEMVTVYLFWPCESLLLNGLYS